MVYSVFYLPSEMHTSLLADTHSFNDSKVLTPQVRSSLMRSLCTPGSDLHRACGWAVRVLSARDISAGMLKPVGSMYNLNAQAMDATIALIQDVLDRGVNLREIYIDTIGKPQIYQQKLERLFPGRHITVATKADRDYPCVSAASVCAKTSRDTALEMCYKKHLPTSANDTEGWGSGYPSDARCVSWLKAHKDPFFGWGNECRFSWGTVKDLLETKDVVQVTWPKPALDHDVQTMAKFMVRQDPTEDPDAVDLFHWFHQPAEAVF